MKLRTKISLSIVIILLILGSILSFFIQTRVSETIHHEFDEKGHVLSRILAKQSEDFILKEDFVSLNLLIDEAKRTHNDIDYIFILDSEGNIVAHTFDEKFPVQLTESNLFKGQVSRNMVSIETEKGMIRDHTNPILEGKLGVLRVGISENYILQEIRYTITELFVYIFASLFIGLFAISFLINRFVIMQIGGLNKDVNEIRSGNFNVRAKVFYEDELGFLAHSFNKMASSLKNYKIKEDKHKEELENAVKKRTEELNQKVKELTETKNAVMNMMEDAEELNTKLINTQSELKKNIHELRALDIKKDEFTSIVSHELKTPLTAIKGLIQFLHNEDIISNVKERNKYLEVINKETVRLEQLISDILDISKLDLKTIKFNFEKTSLSDLQESLLMRFDLKAEEKGLAFKCDFGKDIKYIVTDVSRLVQVFSNLINNALHYTEKGGITLSAFKEGAEAHFTVSDTGIGIPKSQFSKLFQRFSQIDSSITRKVGGSGLGLAISKGIVERMGGKIWIESVVGKGTTFHVKFPINQKIGAYAK